MRWNGKQTIKNAQAGQITQLMIVGPSIRHSATDAERVREALRRAIRRQLGADIDRHRLKQPEAIDVPWSLIGCPDKFLDRASAAGPFPEHGNGNDVPKLFRNLPADRRQLVVLGEPGSGKSILARLIAWEFLSMKEDGDPVPILLSLSSWRPRVALQEWIAQRAMSLVPARGRFKRELRREIAESLISEGLVIPILDGLDELPKRLHGPATEAIDAAMGRGLPLVVTCREADYESSVEETGLPFTSAIQIRLEGVGADQAIKYLRDSPGGSDRWKDVFVALREQPDHSVSKVFCSPLMLYLARTVYRVPSSTPGELLRIQSEAEIETHLLGSYLPALYSSHPRYTPEKVERYLRLIAYQIKRDETRDFAWWQLSSPGVGVLAALLHGGAWGWFFNVLSGPGFGAVSGIAAFLAVGLIYENFRARRNQVYITEDHLYRPDSSLFRYSLVGFFSGVLAAIMIACASGGLLLLWVGVDLSVALYYASPFGLVSGFSTLFGSAWGVYRLSHLWFWVTGRLPRRPADFLQDAHRLGVLRESGVVYQFRHSRLQEHLLGSPLQSTESAYTPRISVGRWAVLLPFLPGIAQVMSSIVGTLFVCIMSLSIFSAHGSLWNVVEGDLPLVRSLPSACTEAYCPSEIYYVWELSAGSSKYAVPGMPDENSINSWGGHILVDGCKGAAVSITLSLGEGPPRNFTLASGSRWDADLHALFVKSGKKATVHLSAEGRWKAMRAVCQVVQAILQQELLCDDT